MVISEKKKEYMRAYQEANKEKIKKAKKAKKAYQFER